MPALKLPHADGRLEAFELSSPATWRAPSQHPQWNRVAFAAAHVVAAPLAPMDPGVDAAIDGDARLARGMCPIAGRLCVCVRSRAIAGACAGDPALARRNVRSCARRLLDR